MMDNRQKELTMTELRNNGFAVSLGVLAFVVCYVAILPHFGQSPQSSIATIESGFSSTEREDVPVTPTQFAMIENGEIRRRTINDDNPQCLLTVPRNFDPEVYQQIIQTEPRFHKLVLQAGNPPEAVPVPGDTFPVDPQHDENEDDETANAAVRSVIERELSHTTREERDIWFDELKTLPAGVVRDLLQVRKQLRALPRIMGGIPEKLASADPVSNPRTREIIAEPASQKIRFQAPDDYSATSALETAISQLRHNLMNASTPGFKRLRVTLVDTYSPLSLDPVSTGSGLRGEGCQMAPQQLDLKQGTLKNTGRQLDLAIEGEGFFVIRQGEKELLTRCGAFTMDRDRQIGLTVTEASLLLHPIIKVPEDSRELQISADGVISILKSSDATLIEIGRIQLARVASPARLQPMGQTLLLPNEDSGPITFGAAMSAGLGEVQQGFLEQSNVEFQAELDEIEELTMILKATPVANSRPVTASGPQSTKAR
jgi:flagellar basal body rod protein FlgG